MDVTRVVIVDDHEVVRAGLRWFLSNEPGFAVVGEAEDGPGALREVELARPDVVLMDVRLGSSSGIDTCREIKAAFGDTAVLMLTSFGEREAVLASVLAGASGFLLKNTGHAALLRAIRAVAEGQQLIDPAVMGAVTSRLIELSEQVEDPRVAALTPREREVLRLIGQAKSNKQIALELGTSPATARNHVASIMDKLGLHTRTELALFWTALGLGDLADSPPRY
jgi:DNA-binding NarL/FixJ family response regulator